MAMPYCYPSQFGIKSRYSGDTAVTYLPRRKTSQSMCYAVTYNVTQLLICLHRRLGANSQPLQRISWRRGFKVAELKLELF